MDKQNTKAFFRFQVISSVKLRLSQGKPLPEAINLASKEDYLTIEGEVKHAAERTIYTWYQNYEKSGFAGLKDRPKKSSSPSVLPEKFLTFLTNKKKEDPHSSVPEVMRQGILSGLLHPNASRSTVYRACLKLNLPLLKGTVKKESPMRRFSYPHRMQMVLSDGVHFRAGAKMAKRVAFFFIDDATRMILGVIVGPSERTDIFLKGLYEVISRYGLMDTLYIDKGSAFKAHDTAVIASSMGINVIHGKTRYPQGHGKIEKFNQTVRKDSLRNLGRAEVSPSYTSLTLRLNHYIEELYNRRKHESIRMAPLDLFCSDSKPLRFVDEIKERFTLNRERKASLDNVIRIGEGFYELPLGHAGTRVAIIQNFIEGKIYMKHDGRLIQLHLVDLHQNAITKRSQKKKKKEKAPPSPLASDMAFKREMSSVVDNDGNYFDKE